MKRLLLMSFVFIIGMESAPSLGREYSGNPSVSVCSRCGAGDYERLKKKMQSTLVSRETLA